MRVKGFITGRAASALACACALAAATGCRRGEDGVRGGPAAGGQAAAKTPAKVVPQVPTNAHEMIVERNADKVYRGKLKELGEERNKKALALAGIRAEMTKIEAGAGTNTPAMDQLRQEIDGLRKTLAEKEAALAAAAPYKQDPAWQKLEAEARESQKLVDEAQSQVQRLIHDRMQEQYTAMRKANPARGAAVRNEPPRPDYRPADTNVTAATIATLMNRTTKVVPARPMPHAATNAAGAGAP